MELVYKPKKKCCKDSPYRCKKCPVVSKRLIRDGFARKRKSGLVVLSPDLTKKQYKAARKR